MVWNPKKQVKAKGFNTKGPGGYTLVPMTSDQKANVKKWLKANNKTILEYHRLNKDIKGNIRYFGTTSRPEARVAEMADTHIIRKKSPTTAPIYKVEISYADPEKLKTLGYDDPKKIQAKESGSSFKTLKEAKIEREKIYKQLAKKLDVDVDYFKNPSKEKSFALLARSVLPEDKKNYITSSELAIEMDAPEKYLRKSGPGPVPSHVAATEKLLKRIDLRDYGYSPLGKNVPFYAYKPPTKEDKALLEKYKTLQGKDYIKGTGYNFVTPELRDRIKLLAKSPFVANLIKNKDSISKEDVINQESTLNKYLKKNKMSLNQFVRGLMRYGEALDGTFLIGVTDPILSDQSIKQDIDKSSKIFKILNNSTHRGLNDPMKSAMYRAAMSDISDQLGQQRTTFENYKAYLRNRVAKLLGKGSGLNIDELVGVSSSARNKTGPYAVFSRVIGEDLNKNELRAFQHALSGRTAKLRAEIAANSKFIKGEWQHSDAAKKIVKDFKKEIYDPYKVNLKSLGYKDVGLPQLTLGAPTSKLLGGGEGRLAELAEQGLGFEEFHKKEGFGYRMPKGVLTQKELLGNKKLFDRLIKAADLNENRICKLFPKAAARGGLAQGGCGEQMRQALADDLDGTVKQISEFKSPPGEKTNVRTIARQLLAKVPKGGRLGAILAGAGAVGAGTWAMMGGTKADETPTTDQMTYNATEGKFVDAAGDPETQEGVLNWIGEHPIISGVAAIPVGMGAGLGADAMKAENVGKFFRSMKFMLPPAYAAEKLYQYKEGQDLGQMFTNPLDAVWAMALDTPRSAAGKMDYYRNIAQKRVGIGPLAKGAVEAEQLGLRHLDPRKFKETGAALKRATMAPRSAGTSLVFPFAKGAAPATMGRGMAALRAGSRLLPLGPIPMALLAGSMAWDKYKFNKKIGDHVDALRSEGVVSEEDAETMNTIYKQGWLGTTAIGAKLLGSEELMLEGELLDIEGQKRILAGMKDFYGKRENTATKERVGDRQEDFFTWFSKGGRVGLKEGGNKKPFGSMTRRGFLKWLVGSIVAGTAALTGRGLKQATKTAVPTVTKGIPTKFAGVEGMPLWFPRAVAKIKAHGKLLSMADKDYVQGDMYEMMIPVTRKYLDATKRVEPTPSNPQGQVWTTKTEYEKVIMEENPLSGEISMQWTGTDNFGGDAARQINFKPGQAGFQKFGVDPDIPQAWEYQRVKVEEPEFTYTQPDQTQPYRDDIEYLDIFEEGDEIVKGLEDMTGGKNMVAKDGTVIDVSGEGKKVDEAFKKKIYKDIEGEDALVPEPEGHVGGPEGDWIGESANEIIGGDIPEWVPKEKMWDPTKKASGGIIETGNIARRPGAVPPLSGPTPQGQGIVGLFSSPKRVNIA